MDNEILEVLLIIKDQLFFMIGLMIGSCAGYFIVRDKKD